METCTPSFDRVARDPAGVVLRTPFGAAIPQPSLASVEGKSCLDFGALWNRPACPHGVFGLPRFPYVRLHSGEVVHIDSVREFTTSEGELMYDPPDAEHEDALAATQALIEREEAASWGIGPDGEPFAFRANTRPRGLVDGGTFLYDIPDGTPSMWGDGKRVVHAEGEGLMVTGQQGVGKTTLSGLLAFGLAGVPGFETLLGLPVRALPEGKIVLYLALDRPQQIARAHRRLAAPEHRALIASRIKYLAGSELPFSRKEMLTTPTRLAAWAVECNAGVVFVDSLKDAVGTLSDEETAAAWNLVVQECLAVGVEVVLLHHNRKANAENRKPKTLDDVHGSGNLTRGLGSVVCLYGEPGAVEVELLHLKQPAEPVGPYVVALDHDTGRALIAREGVLATGSKATRKRQVQAHFMTREVGEWVSRDDISAAGVPGSKPALSDTLAELVAEGLLDYIEGEGRGHPSMWARRPLSTPSLDFLPGESV